MLKKLLLLLIIVVVVIGILYIKKHSGKTAQNSNNSQDEPQKNLTTQIDKPQIVSTKPDPLDNSIISATEVVEITFNRPLENVGEFKVRIEPKIDYKVELSSDRKTARIKPTNPYELGTTYTIFIGTDTKFDGVGAWGQEKIFHINTIKYRGV